MWQKIAFKTTEEKKNSHRIVHLFTFYAQTFQINQNNEKSSFMFIARILIKAIYYFNGFKEIFIIDIIINI